VQKLLWASDRDSFQSSPLEARERVIHKFVSPIYPPFLQRIPIKCKVLIFNYVPFAVPFARRPLCFGFANIAGSMAGGFAGGAVGGGLSGSVYGGNPWQSALYGGIIGAASAGLVAGAVELNNLQMNNLSEAKNMYASSGDGILDAGSPPAEKECVGNTRILKGNENHIGKEGAFKGVKITQDSAAIEMVWVI
jgi:hypothetical protein